MGVPKFYRWISERYPCLSEVVKEFQIPTFDNLYLDMNGIIHTCSHPNDDDPHFRISEEQIFANICHYIDFLFKIIKPKKNFFMAVDGVAPRAKMNQQRGRRFRTAKAAVILEEQAVACGEELPDEARFDSNCITPGTPFMARLQKVLKGFVTHKISSDRLWQGVKVYLSGHETPGEGEHKIMDFIRYEKSMPGYDPNMRHCLYGLDADLIMLGLCSHEPHFSLLREEVKFGGKKKQKRLSTPEETTFHLLHLSLLRDYLSHEFSPVCKKLSFAFDIEKIIDDFVLMSFLVGNDFIPHLPQLHIQHDALPVLFKNYMDVLPKLGGYINEEGYLNLERFQLFLDKLSEYDFAEFSKLSDDFAYLESKTSKPKKDIVENEKNTVDFLSQLGFSKLSISKTAEFDMSSEEEEDLEDESTLELEFSMHKSDYYKTKLELEEVTPEILKGQAEGYVRAIQWNLHYYYNGVVSWSWYYPHHYSPYISDIKNFKDMEMNFQLGSPFLPFQQLLAVLPKLSKDLLPESYQILMCEEDSPLIDYYPDDFATDMNGKQQEWEAVVLIPFINEKLLIKCTLMADKKINEEERKRNCHGPHHLYMYEDKGSGALPSFLPGFFPATFNNHAKVTCIEKDYYRLNPELIYKGLCKNVVLDKIIIGFPTLRTLKHTANLKNEKVKVFQMVSMKDNMMLTMDKSPVDLDQIAFNLVGKTIYVGWPHLQEAKVTSITDGKVKYIPVKNAPSTNLKVAKENMLNDEQKIWKRQVESVDEHCFQRWGIIVGEIDVLVHVKCFSGSKLVLTKDNEVVEEKQYDGSISNFAWQTVVCNIDEFSPDVKQSRKVEDIFELNTTVFALQPQYYGCLATVSDSNLQKNNGNIKLDIEIETEPDLNPVIQNQHDLSLEQFMNSHIAAQQLGTDSNFVSRITGTVLVQTSPKGSSSPNRVNIGLNLKFNRRNEEVQGYSRKVFNKWLYSDDTVKTLNNYFEKFADFFEKLYSYINDDVIYIEDLYSLDEGKNIVKEISSWLKEQSCTRADRQKCGIEKLDLGVMAAIERAVLNMPKKEVYHLKKNVKPNQIYSPFLCKGVFIPDPSATFYLFDRVVNVCHSTSVPLGLRGTVVGIQSAEKESDYMYEILFDKEFIGGVALSSDTKKGYRMPPNALINISHGDRMKRNDSPTKPMTRLNRTSVFDAAIKQLKTIDSPPIQILQKTSSTTFNNKNSSPYIVNSQETHRKPIESFSNNMDAFTSPSLDKQFVTPKAKNNLSGAYNSSPSQQNTTGSPQYDFQNFWANLKKTLPDTLTMAPNKSFVNTPNQQLTQKPKCTPESNYMFTTLNQQTNDNHKQKVKLPSADHNYGQKVSVEELFQGVKGFNSNSQISVSPVKENRNVSPLLNPNPPPTEAPDILRQLCLQHFKQPPYYSYNNFGNTNLYIATIRLPNGNNISSIPCPSKLEAASKASENALAQLNLTISSIKPLVTVPQQYQSDVGPYYRPPPAPTPMGPTAMPYFIPRSPFGLVPSPMPNVRYPPPPFRQAFYEQPQLLRHPQPMHSPYIPDSYVKANQMIFSESELGSSVMPNVLSVPPRTNIAKDRDVFHLPGGGIATVPRSQSLGPKSSENLFVPAQVLKQSVRTQDGRLSSTEWPGLPAKQNAEIMKKPIETQCWSQEQTKDITISSEKNSEVSASPVNKSLSQTSSMTVLKPKKRRIAANFSNSLS